MRTKEYVIEMCPEDLRMFDAKVHQGISVYHDGHTAGNLRPLKAKLIIELPERKVEISESDIDKAFEQYAGQGSADFYRERLKEKLFKDQP